MWTLPVKAMEVSTSRFDIQNTMSERHQQQTYVLPSEKFGTYRNEEYNDGGNSPQGRKKVWSSFQGNFGKRSPQYEDGGYEPQPSHLQEDDGNVLMRDVQEDPQVRHIPYSTRRDKRRVKWQNEGHIHITVWRDRKTLKREMGENTQDGTPGNWFKITIPCGRKYDKTWLMNSIQNHCSVPFTPVDFHYVKNQARFFVQDVGTASALKDVSYKICDEENRKISIFVNPSTVPYSVRYKLEPEEMEQLKLTMNKRYDVSQQALDLQCLRFDPDLVRHDIDIILNRRNCMAATLQIIEENFPELLSLNLSNNKLYRLDGLSDIIEMVPTVKILDLSKNELNLVWELNKMKGLDLEELWLEGNPLCDTFPDQSTYISAIKDCFPKLLRLDGQELPSPIIIDTDTPCLMKPCKESYKGSDALKSLVLQFLQQYYLIYDSGDRQGLLDAYHDEACFSLAIPFNPEDPAPSSLCEYFKENRNMKKPKEPCASLCVQPLKYTKHNIVGSLCVLPKTQHDLSSFLVDMWFQTWRESLSVLFVLSPGPSSLPLPAIPGAFRTTIGTTTELARSSLCSGMRARSQRRPSSKSPKRSLGCPRHHCFSFVQPKAMPMTGDGGLADQEIKMTLQAR
ncbi:nuclear RNA export factor 2-like isoform X2 [Zalophus californianus]|uniref:Nuclear RNA export factor 2-like isoform X2 n=1 Tax=Zalophus californianus TaxID=9704 RepID=A0A6P9F7V2_ZALCA|nr:nuclear RNA export factor 2-like isoform X2 [Zalophus californianus]